MEHVCKCGCGEPIIIKKYHKYRGIPKYRQGHNAQKYWNIPIRICKGCNKELVYKSHGSYRRAEENKSMCFDCTVIGVKRPPRPKQWRKNLSKSQLGEKGSNWQGGKNRLNNSIRSLAKYAEWRNSIYERDDYTCQICGKRGEQLNAHHKRSLSVLINEHNILTTEEALECKSLWNIDNGLTICIECHDKLHEKHGYHTIGTEMRVL